MIGSIKGTVIHLTDNSVILETSSGVGYKIQVGKMAAGLDESIRLFTYHQVREDADDLYGFTKPEDLRFFELLLSVSGVGPKMALAVISTLDRQLIADAILSNQPAIFKSVSGVGQKVAEKIIVELKSKMTGLPQAQLSSPDGNDLFSALTSLGYHQNEIGQVLTALDPNLPTQEKLKQALRLLAK